MRWLLALVLTLLAPRAHANGRFPGTSTIAFRAGNPQDIAVGVTYGLALSHDGGASWRWMCERAVGYGGVFDPLYLYRASGRLLATTVGGLRDDKDGCRFDDTQLAATYVTALAVSSTGTIYAAASDPADARIYRSGDDGATFTVAASPGITGDQWDSLVVAPSDPMRVYLTGHRLAGGVTTLLLAQSTNGGDTFIALPQQGLVTTMQSRLTLAGISASDPDVIYLRVALEYGNSGEGLYTIDATSGTSWTRLHDQLEPFAFVARASGELVVGSQTSGAQHSVDGGASWVPLSSPPHIACLVENTLGEVWACTQNYSSMTIEGDGFGVMKSRDLVTWTGVMRYEDLVSPVECPVGSPQRDDCQDAMWCPLRMQLGITSEAIACGTTDTTRPPPGGGCCDASSAPGPVLLVALGCLVLPRRRRR